ncbi:MAG: fumarylacetoacetase [Rhodocyclaceae bacterium]|nr:fumarylacetoacetase [Rhodocyclaceae bacterium]MBX3671116.1 fumarylacetoacetase [Rhodocyclaceae bacterium]
MSAESGIDATHDPARMSWVDSANVAGCEFPIQNLPYGRYRAAGDTDWRLGVAIGDQILDLRRAGLVDHADMNRLMELDLAARANMRFLLAEGLTRASADEARWREALVPMGRARMGLPCRIGDYTDFYAGIYHATAVGRLFRPDNPLLPNYKWVPIGYHGRASTIEASGHGFPRPCGQYKGEEDVAPRFGPSQRLDFELELGVFVGRPNPRGQAIRLDQAEEHIFGFALFNDWSARDLQAWEYQPLGPFLAKNFVSTVSPWIVTLEALAPFRRPWQRPADDPQPLPYLEGAANRARGAFAIDLEVRLQTQAMRAAGNAPERISHSNFADAAYWTIAQLVAHHTVNGCALMSGDLIATGTLSGPAPDQAGSLLELSAGGKRAIRLSNGETRTFLHDGDSITLHGRCAREGFRPIGFGECTATVFAALAD